MRTGAPPELALRLLALGVTSLLLFATSAIHDQAGNRVFGGGLHPEGAVSTGSSSGVFPVKFSVSPATCGVVQITTGSGPSYSTMNATNGTTEDLATGAYQVWFPSCPGLHLATDNTTGSVRMQTVDDPYIQGLTVTGPGNVSVGYVRDPHVNLTVRVSPTGCGPVWVNGTVVSNGSVLNIRLHSYAAPFLEAGVNLSAGSCQGYTFDFWFATSNGVIPFGPTSAVSSVTISGNCTVEAVYERSNATSPPLPLVLIVSAAGIGGGALVAAFVVYRRRAMDRGLFSV